MKRMFGYLKPYMFLAILSPLMMVGEVFADLCLPYLMSFIVNYGIEGMDVLDPSKGSTVCATLVRMFYGDGFTRMNIIYVCGALMLLITAVGGFFGAYSSYTSSKASQSLGRDLRKDAYRHVMSLSLEQTDAFTTGSLVTRMTNDISMVIEFFNFLMRGVVRSPMFLVGGIAMLLTMNRDFSLIVAASFPILILAIVLVFRKVIPMFTVVQEKLDVVNSVVQENVNSARVVKAYNKEAFEGERFETANQNLYNVNYQAAKMLAALSPVLTIVSNLVVLGIIYVGGIRISIGDTQMTTGVIMASISYATQIISGLLMMSSMFQMVSRTSASAKRINEVLETEPAIVGKDATGGDSDVMISFDHVYFQYPNTIGRPVLQDIHFDVHRGETLAIIGATGSGKTSLANLIARFYDVSGGSVKVEGVDVREYDLTALRNKIGFVMQKSELFSDTIERNITWGKDDATHEEVVEACKVAQAYDFIMSKEHQFDEQVAEKGSSLSGGQKQRVSLARALLRKPEILILDDSTSALDLATETLVRKGLKEFYDDTTIIMIAQRIASVQQADRIAVLEQEGTICHIGTHEQLLETCDTYREIYESQIKTGAYQVAKGGAVNG